MKSTRILILAALLSLLAGVAVQAGDGRVSGKYAADPVHSGVGFKIKHMGVSNVSGKFDDFSASIDINYEHPEKSSVSAVVKAASVNTGNEKRDNHLRSADFFDVEKYPEIRFTSTKVKAVATGEFEVTGDLSFHGVTKSITVDVEQTGVADIEKKGPVTGFETSFTVKRTDFGMAANPFVGDDVKLTIEVEAGQAPKG